MNPSSVSIVTSLSLVDITYSFMASSSTETLSPLLNIFFFFILIILILLGGTQLHHAKHKMAIAITVIYTFLSALTCSKATSIQESSLELLIFSFLSLSDSKCNTFKMAPFFY
jgi:hypothetical protein